MAKRACPARPVSGVPTRHGRQVTGGFRPPWAATGTRCRSPRRRKNIAASRRGGNFGGSRGGRSRRFGRPRCGTASETGDERECRGRRRGLRRCRCRPRRSARCLQRILPLPADAGRRGGRSHLPDPGRAGRPEPGPGRRRRRTGAERSAAHTGRSRRPLERQESVVSARWQAGTKRITFTTGSTR